MFVWVFCEQPLVEIMEKENPIILRVPIPPMAVVGQSTHFGPILDWSLLSSELSFVYLDPVLASHLDDWETSLIGKSLRVGLYPFRRANTACTDLTDALEKKTTYGTVTRSVHLISLRFRYLDHPFSGCDTVAFPVSAAFGGIRGRAHRGVAPTDSPPMITTCPSIS